MVRESTGLAPEYSDTLRPSKTVHMGFDGAAYRNFVRLRSDLTVVHTGLPFRSPSVRKGHTWPLLAVRALERIDCFVVVAGATVGYIQMGVCQFVGGVTEQLHIDLDEFLLPWLQLMQQSQCPIKCYQAAKTL